MIRSRTLALLCCFAAPTYACSSEDGGSESGSAGASQAGNDGQANIAADDDQADDDQADDDQADDDQADDDQADDDQADDDQADDDQADDDQADDDQADDDQADDDQADDDTESCPVGEETCSCYGNGTCNEALSCRSGICVEAGGSATGGTGNVQGQGGAGGSTGVAQDGAGSGGADVGTGGSTSASGGTSVASGGSDVATGGTTTSGVGTGGSESSTGGTTLASGGESSATGGESAAGGTTSTSGGTTSTSGGTTSTSGGTTSTSGGTTSTSGGTTSTSGGTTSASGGTTSTSGGTTSTSGGASTGGNDPGTGGREVVEYGDSGLIPSDSGNFVWDWDVSGVIGPWFTFADSAGSAIVSVYESPITAGAIGSSGGRMCFQGTAAGHLDEYWDTHWGAGVGLLVCAYPGDMSWLPEDMQSQASAEQSFLAADCPTILEGVTSVTFTVTGTWDVMRFVFSESEENTQPFVEIPYGATYTVYPSDAEVPLWENEPNAGAQGSPNVVSLNFQIVSQTDTESFEFCIEDLTIN